MMARPLISRNLYSIQIQRYFQFFLTEKYILVLFHKISVVNLKILLKVKRFLSNILLK